MKRSEIIQFLSGYIVGGGLFAVLIPYALYTLSISSNNLIKIDLSENLFIKILSVLLLIIGIIFVLWSNLFLFMKGKGGPAEGFGIEISPKTKHLVISGPYRYTRNPMVFGAFSCYFALALIFNSIFTVGILVLFYMLAVIYLKNSEEKRLIRDFGKEYIQYKKQVPMIFPWLKKIKK